MPNAATTGDVFASWQAAARPHDNPTPPHFHIEAPDFEVLVRISDLSVIAGGARAAQIREVLDWAATRRTELELKWVELNRRG